MREIDLYQVDAFTEQPFRGNPAAVCLLQAVHLPLAREVRQQIAAEQNLSETAFVELLQDESGTVTSFQTAEKFTLRWFTPVKEVALCGHATMAAAAAILDGGNRSLSLAFQTSKSGWLTVKPVHRGDKVFQLQMSMPLNVPTNKQCPSFASKQSTLLKALMGQQLDWVEDVLFATHLQYLLVVLSQSVSRQQLEGHAVDARGLASAHQDGELVGIIVSCRENSDGSPYDCYSRFFAPWSGIDEDSVTGSAHAVLGPYWAKVMGKTNLKARQCSPRGGDLELNINEAAGTVEATGWTAIVSKGVLYLP